ncbi:hypothetical protein ABMA28_002193, partial [Loxostege sticticalis]
RCSTSADPVSRSCTLARWAACRRRRFTRTSRTRSSCPRPRPLRRCRSLSTF